MVLPASWGIPSQFGDVSQIQPLMVEFRLGHVLADWKYDADDLRCFIVDKGGQPDNYRIPIVHD